MVIRCDASRCLEHTSRAVHFYFYDHIHINDNRNNKFYAKCETCFEFEIDHLTDSWNLGTKIEEISEEEYQSLKNVKDLLSQ